jgi:hypothetical protein
MNHWDITTWQKFTKKKNIEQHIRSFFGCLGTSFVTFGVLIF